MRTTMRHWLLSASLAGLAWLAGCGGGGSGATVEPPPPVVARIELGPAALLLTPAAPTQALSARAFDATGRQVDAPLTFVSSQPEQFAVTGNGQVRALVAVGSGQVHAEVAGARSNPVLVTAAEVGAGVQLLDDSQVVSLPVAVDPTARGVDIEVETVLAGLGTVPAPGALLLGRQGLSIGGEVVSAQAEGPNVRVRLRLPDLRRLLPRAQIKETIDLRDQPLTPSPEVAALYDFAKVGDEWVFTPKPGVGGATPEPIAQADSSPRAQAANAGPGYGGEGKPLAIGGPVRKPSKFKLGPFECEIFVPQLPVNLSNPAGFTIKFEPIYTVDYDQNDGLRKIELSATASFKMKSALQFNVGGIANLTCDAVLKKDLAKLPGWAGLIFSGEIKAGVGFEAEGAITLPAFGVEAQLELTGQVVAGIDCSSGDCQTTGRFVPTSKSGWRMISPADLVGNARSELFLFAYGFTNLKAGATLVEQARIQVFAVRGGVKAETNLAPETTQMVAPVLPGFADYRSDYKLSLLAEIAAGSNNDGATDLRTLLQRLGFFKATLLKWQIATPLGTSPKATVSVDKVGVRNGDTANFTVRLDPAAAYLNLPLVGIPATRAYNIDRIRIVRAGPNESTRTVATVTAVPDQLDFALSWVAEGVVDVDQGQFSAFVDTAIPLPFGLELGPAALSTQRVLFRGDTDGNLTNRVLLGELGAATAVTVPSEVENGFRSFTRKGSFSPDGRFILYSKNLVLTPQTTADKLFVYSADDGSIRPLTTGAREERLAAWSPSGDSFVYASEPENRLFGSIEIRRRVIASGDDLLLFSVLVDNNDRFNDSRGRFPVEALAWSPDGVRVAVVMNLPSGPRAAGLVDKELYVVNADGSGLRLVLTFMHNASGPVEIDWSPDARHIALVQTTALADGSAQPRVSLLDVDTGTLVALTQPPVEANFDHFRDSNPVFSPDGSRVAFTRTFSSGSPPVRNDGVGVHVVGVNGLGATRLLDGTGVGASLHGWHRDGDALVASGVAGPGVPNGMLVVPLVGAARAAMAAPVVARLGVVLQRPLQVRTDMAVEIVGSARREPGEAFTLVINLRNRSAVEATAVRVEFEVPPGWNITDLTGGTGCERSLSSVVCRLDSVTRVTPRAVLVDVIAPEVIGEHKLVARVSSLELESDPTNNVAELAVDIGAPRR
jgi:Tol biopolymer transport system component